MKSIKITLTMAFAFALMISMAGCGEQGGSDNAADIAFTNGLVYMADEAGDTAEAAAVKGDEIVYVGDAPGVEEFIGDNTRVVDLNGGMLLPGFIDSHQHPYGMVEMLYTVQLYECETGQAYLDEVTKYYKENPDADKIVGVGFDTPIFNKISPTRETLDKITADIPIALFDSGEHACLMNTKALEKIGMMDKDYKPADGETVEKDADGVPTGWVMDSENTDVFLSDFSVEQLKEGLKEYQDMALSYGITTTFEDAPGVFENTIKAYQELEASDELKYRVSAYMRIAKGDDYDAQIEKLKKYKEENSDGLLRVDGAKIFIDGALEAETAYMAEPYVNDPKNSGVNMWEGATDELNELCKKLEAENLNYHFHAIGDAACTEALDAIEYAKKDAKKSRTRPAITHLQFVDKDDVQRWSDLDVTAAIQAFWAVYDEYYDQAIEYVGQERADHQYPIQSLFDADIRVASGSDFPVQTDRPLEAIQEGVLRAYPGEEDGPSLPPDSEKATVEEMLQSYTLNGAIANYREDEVGTIDVGKKADLVVLDKNLLEIDPSEIADTKELMTVFNGEVVYELQEDK